MTINQLIQAQKQAGQETCKQDERLQLLKNAKPSYVIYWHFIEGMNNPFTEGYIGIAKVTPNANRWNSGLKLSYISCDHFYKVICKYGEEKIFTKILYDGLTIEQANCIEFTYRPFTHIGWNIRQGGGNRGILAESTKLKISLTKKNQEYPYEKIFTEETREKIRKSKLGNKNRLGLHNSEEMKLKQSISAKKRGVSEKFKNATKKKVICLETGLIFESLTSAKNYLNIKSSTPIYLSCRNRNLKAGGYHWRYYNWRYYNG